MTAATPFPHVPAIQGRILIDGRIQDTGYARRQVFSTCHFDPQAKQGTLLGETPNVDAAKLMEAVDAASRAWGQGLGDWPTARMEDRLTAIANFRDQLLTQRELVCRLLMWEIGKAWPDTQAEFDRTVTYINDTMEEVKRMDRDASRLQFAGGIMAQIRRAPLGVTLCMGPFNYPLNETFTTLIPALVMGNTVVVKLPRYGELLWDCLLPAFRACFPAGVVNIVNGAGRQIIGPAVQSGKIDVLAFIGSSAVANRIKQAHPHPHRFRSILGLDAKNPAIILPDADLSLAISECLKGALSFNGQRCTALKILFVHRDLAPAFCQGFTEAVNAMVCGMPWETGVQITPLPDANKPAYLQQLIDDALAKGATHCHPGLGGRTQGSLFFPAVIKDVPLDSRLAQEEQFGPLVPIHSFDRLEEVENYIINSPYGSQVSLFGRDPRNIGPCIDRLANQVCRINLNTLCQRGPDVFPFTGRKDSAEGTLSVYDALRSFSIRAMVAAKQDAAGKELIRGVLQGNTSRFLTSNILL